jgi:uncharacterized protein DUF3147
MARDLVLLALKGLAGGAAVVAFSLLSGVLKPKLFAGLFAAAPSVAIASLAVTAFVSGGPRKAEEQSIGMVAGALGMVAYCVCAALLLRRIGGWLGGLLPWLAWGAFAFGAYEAALR